MDNSSQLLIGRVEGELRSIKELLERDREDRKITHEGFKRRFNDVEESVDSLRKDLLYNTQEIKQMKPTVTKVSNWVSIGTGVVLTLGFLVTTGVAAFKLFGAWILAKFGIAL